jgi:hypothetical protein
MGGASPRWPEAGPASEDRQSRGIPCRWILTGLRQQEFGLLAQQTGQRIGQLLQLGAALLLRQPLWDGGRSTLKLTLTNCTGNLWVMAS